MIVNTVISVDAYGDFDVRYTAAILYSEEVRDVKAITKAYCSLRGLESTSGLPYNMLSDTTEDFIKYLKKEGFRELKNNTVCFSD